jgi:hypothetical protein
MTKTVCYIEISRCSEPFYYPNLLGTKGYVVVVVVVVVNLFIHYKIAVLVQD